MATPATGNAAWSCGSYFDYLFDRTPHFDEDVLIDWFPTDDAWIGQVMTGAWDAFSGTTHTYDRMHVGFPDLSQASGPVRHSGFQLRGRGLCATGYLCRMGFHAKDLQP